MSHGHRHPHEHAHSGTARALAHHHEHAVQAHGAGTGMRRLALSVALTAGIMIAEAIGGFVSGSLALVSDAGHMLTDASALGIALVAAWLALRPANDKRTFGYRRAEVLAAQINAGLLVVLCVWIAWEAVERLQRPGPPIRLGMMAGVAAIGLLGNLAILYWLRGERGLNERSAFLHVLSDAVASIGVLTGAGVMALAPSLRWIDSALSLAIAGLILWGALRLVLEITDILMEGVPRHVDAAAVLRLMTSADGVRAVHDLHIWTISSGVYSLSAHVVVDTGAVGRNDEILTSVKAALREYCGIDHTTLQIESAEYAHVDDVHMH